MEDNQTGIGGGWQDNERQTVVRQILDDFIPSPKLPSKLQIGDEVVVRFGDDSIVNHAFIVGVSFSDGKVFYDAQVAINANNSRGYTTIIRDVDSTFVTAK